MIRTTTAVDRPEVPARTRAQPASIRLATALAKTPTTLRDLLLRTGSDATKIACAMSFPSSPMVSEKA